MALVDGDADPGLDCPTKTIVRGDTKVAAISAASILAKVARDDLMVSASKDYPEYGFDRHKGYGTREHMFAKAIWSEQTAPTNFCAGPGSISERRGIR